MSLFIIIALALPARAGGFWEWCSRHLVAPDPYEWEQSPLDIVCRKLRALEIRERWGKLDYDEKLDLKILRDEIQKRRNIATALGQPVPACE